MDSFSRSHTLRFEGGIGVAATDNFIDEPPFVDRYITADAAFAAALASSPEIMLSRGDEGRSGPTVNASRAANGARQGGHSQPR